MQSELHAALDAPVRPHVRDYNFASFEIRVGWHYVHTLGVLPGRGAMMFQSAV